MRAPLLALGCLAVALALVCSVPHRVRPVGANRRAVEGSLGGPMAGCFDGACANRWEAP